ncbi:MAG: NAD(P)-binding domain-containing protein [Nocardioidaceae bacterium]|nr:NAD(P)-binding domain-containing protein [Nocardioidaceae bacterium]NUS52770.1 NAD(P)-binding domain-containing protein [Nocardioidaceae bacterium]
MTTTQHLKTTDTTARSDLDVLVVGAGQAGLSLAWHLAGRGLAYLLVDAGEVGGSWRSRWDSLRLFTPAQYDGLPGSAFPAPADTYPGKDDVADYLASYAATHRFPIRTGTRVTRLVPAADGFTAHTTGGTLRARNVVVATGAFQRPHVPALGERFDPSVTQLHTSGYRNPGSVPGERVLVVGAGNSGLQTADELAGSHRVTLASGSRALALPQRVVGRDLFWWLTRTGVLDKPADSRLARRVRARGDLVIGADRRRLARRVDVRPRLADADGRAATFADGSSVEVDSVLWATGFRPDYTWIEADVTDADGAVRHRSGRSPVPGLWFLGLPWQRTRGSSLLGFVQRDAADLAARVDAAVRA